MKFVVLATVNFIFLNIWYLHRFKNNGSSKPGQNI